MIVKKTEFFSAALHFRELFTIAYESVSSAEIIIVKITAANGAFGLGSAAPDIEVTGETIKKCLTLLDKKFNKEFFEYPLALWWLYHEKIQREFAGFPSLQSAIEEALLNLLASSKKIRLLDIFGGYRTACPILFTIGIDDIDKTIARAKQAVRQGFEILKLKCGIDIEADLFKIQRLKKVLPQKVQLAIDANQGYSLAQAKKLISQVKNSGIAFFEQPIAAANLGDLKELSQISAVPIIADEAVVNLQEAIEVITNNCAQGINIKLMKCGGPLNFLRIFHLAKAFNKIVMLGCMYESNVSITTGANLALALPLDYADLDSGHLDFADDPVMGGAIVKNGQIFLSNQSCDLRS